LIYEIISQPKKIDTALLDNAVSFACDYLDLDLDLTIEFTSLRRHQYGFCDYEEDEIIILIAKRLSSNDVVRTLFHELVHVKQHAEGRLQHNQIWLGEKVEANYEDLPWEQEAFELEQKMVDIWSESVYTKNR
jgi:hypothetical protein